MDFIKQIVDILKSAGEGTSLGISASLSEGGRVRIELNVTDSGGEVRSSAVLSGDPALFGAADLVSGIKSVAMTTENESMTAIETGFKAALDAKKAEKEAEKAAAAQRVPAGRQPSAPASSERSFPAENTSFDEPEAPVAEEAAGKQKDDPSYSPGQEQYPDKYVAGLEAMKKEDWQLGRSLFYECYFLPGLSPETKAKVKEYMEICKSHLKL